MGHPLPGYLTVVLSEEMNISAKPNVYGHCERICHHAWLYLVSSVVTSWRLKIHTWKVRSDSRFCPVLSVTRCHTVYPLVWPTKTLSFYANPGFKIREPVPLTCVGSKGHGLSFPHQSHIGWAVVFLTENTPSYKYWLLTELHLFPDNHLILL